MSTEFNLCPKCGGVKSLKQPEHTRRVRTSVFRACTCKTEPAQKHDGKLGKDSKAHINQSGLVVVEEYDEVAYLYPTEALSLLAWLTQERETLERLAKEQTDGK